MSYEEIKDQFKDVIKYSQGIYNPNVDELFSRWEKAKSKFIERFGGLIFEWPEQIEFNLDENERIKYVIEFADCINSTFNNHELAEFIDNNSNSFFDNVVSYSNQKEIPKGMKLIKAFKYFETNEFTLHHIQDMASHLIQQNKIKGTLCFSVHPLDFLSSSCNTYNWRSCHSLDGEFRSGNLSYMVDTTTFMVYLKGENEQILPFFPPSVPWNSKKWRMLIHADEKDEIMFAGRQYPFSSKSGIDIVLNIYNNLMENPKNGQYSSKYHFWSNDYIKDASGEQLKYRYFKYDSELIPLEKFVQPNIGSLNYNDILNSTCYLSPYYAILNPFMRHSSDELLKRVLKVGDYVSCLHCGMNEIELSETMRCPDCEIMYGTAINDTYTCCDCCGCRMYVDDGLYVEDDLLCDSCCSEYVSLCSHCGEPTYNKELIYIKPKEEDEYEQAVFVCPYCYESYYNEQED